MKPVNPAFIRWYEEPGKPKVPSVTSILQQMPEESYIEKWKASIGEE